MKIIDDGFCPICGEPLCHGDLIRMNNDYKDMSVISQEQSCRNCKKRFEVIFAPIEMNEYLGLKCRECKKIFKDDNEFDKHIKETNHKFCEVITNEMPCL